MVQDFWTIAWSFLGKYLKTTSNILALSLIPFQNKYFIY